ncbi:MAG: VCBS repeat-containing protein [Solirubrobacteraceae bacterium]|nr:VCBS repeat-containing protein [Solirubrobacteraceae bacterium]
MSARRPTRPRPWDNPTRRRVLAGVFVALGGVSLTVAPAAHAGPLQGTSAFGWTHGVGAQDFSNVVGDINGDGRDDLAIGEGTVLKIVFGTRNGFTRANVAAGDGTGLYELQVPDVVKNVEAAGDFDGDGFDDLVVSTNAKAYVFYGGAGVLEGIGPLVGSGRVTTINAAAPTGASDPPLQGLGIGDFDGNGRDDLAVTRKDGVAIVYGGSRTGTIDGNGKNSRTSVITGAVECGVLVYVIPYCAPRAMMSSAVGDFNGDGRDDLAIDSLVGAAGTTVARRSVLFGRTGTFTTSSSTPSSAMEIPRPVGNGTAFYSSMPMRVGDLNGDGKDELHAPDWDAVSAPGTRYVLGTATPPASLNVSTAPSIDVAGGFGGRAVGDQDGDGRREITVLKPQGAWAAAPYRSSGELRLVPVPVGAGVVDARTGTVVKGLPIVEFLRAPLADFDGDRQTDLALTSEDGVRNPGGGRQRLFFVATHGVDVVPPYLIDASINPFRFLASEGSTISITAEESDTTLEFAYARQEVRDGVSSYPTVATERRTAQQRLENRIAFDGTVNGVRLPAGNYTVQVTPIDAAGNRGPERAFNFVLVAEEETTSDLPLSVGALKRSGDAVLTRIGSVMLTNGNPGSRGTAVFPLARDYNELTFEFEATLLGQGAEGLTLAFITAEPDGSGAWLGAGGAQLGYRGLYGYALALDTSKGPNDPSGNFVGWTVGGPVGGGLSWLGTADPGVPLRGENRTSGPAVKVKVVLANQRAKVFIDGSLRLDRYLFLPEETRLAFTASSAGQVGSLIEVENLRISPSA